MSISQKPLRSELGFSSPGFIVDTYGNINITGDFKKNGVPIGFSGTTLASSIIYSSLTTLGTLSSLIVDTTPPLEGFAGVITMLGSGIDSTINNVVIGDDTPSVGKFTNLSSTVSLTVIDGTVTMTPFNTGVIDNITIGGSTPRPGTFTNVSITTTPSNSSHATTKSYVDTANAALKLNATALAIALGS